VSMKVGSKALTYPTSFKHRRTQKRKTRKKTRKPKKERTRKKNLLPAFLLLSVKNREGPSPPLKNRKKRRETEKRTPKNYLSRPSRKQNRERESSLVFSRTMELSFSAPGLFPYYAFCGVTTGFGPLQLSSCFVMACFFSYPFPHLEHLNGLESSTCLRFWQCA